MKFNKFKNLIVNKAKSINSLWFKNNDKLPPREVNLGDFNFGTFQHEQTSHKNLTYNDEFSSIDYSIIKQVKNPFKENFKFLKKDNIYDAKFWDKLLCSKNIEQIKEVFVHQEILQHAVSPHTLQLVVQKYKNIICEDYHTIEEGMNFLKHYSAQLSNEDMIALMTKINQNNYVISQLDEEAMLFISTHYKDQLTVTEFNKVKKNSFSHIQQEKKWFKLLEEKFGERLKDKKVILEVVRKSGSDTFLGVFLTNILQNNNDKSLKLEMLHNLGLLSSQKYIRK